MFSAGQLTAEQKSDIANWVAGGADLSLVQKRLQGEHEISISYMETRFLVSDLGLTIQEETEAPKTKDEEEKEEVEQTQQLASGATTPASNLVVLVDEDPIPGCMISGVVQFSDGEKGMWYVTEDGRPGLECDTKDYQPGGEDIQNFQLKLQELMLERQRPE